MAPTPAYFPTIVISDMHLGIPTNTQASHQLAEFLRNTRCDTLILNGDVIDGSRRENRHIRRFPRAQKEVFDLINQKVAAGTKVIYLPGNHDAKLRNLGLFGKTVMGIEFQPWLDLTDPKGRHLHIAHGDNYRGGKEPSRPLQRRPLRAVFRDRSYTAVTRLSAGLDHLAETLLHRHFGLATRFHAAAARRKHWTEDRAAESLARARQGGFDGVIFGHFHLPGNATAPDGTTYLNSGDWLENFTAVVLDPNGQWDLLHWPTLREDMRRAGTLSAAGETTAARAFRPQTEQMVAAVKKIWPGR